MASGPAQATSMTWLHVSPAKNLDDIVASGLDANRDGGNYAGYETSLDGVYVCRNKHILHSHIAARDMDDHHLIVLVHVEPESDALMDEDAIHSWLEATAREVLGNRGLSIRDAADGDLEPDDPIWSEVASALDRNLGQRDEQVTAEHPGLLVEYVDAWVRHDVYGEDGDPLWWPDAKDALVRMYPRMGHPSWGEGFLSIRIPYAVGHEGAARVVGVIEVLDGNPRLAAGLIPVDARDLVEEVLWDPKCCSDPLATLEATASNANCPTR